MRALQQPPNAAHATRAISKHPPPPFLYKVPTYSTRVGAAPRAPGGARHGGGIRAVTSQPRMGQSTSYGDVKSSYGRAGGRDTSGCAKGAPRSANRRGGAAQTHKTREPHQEGQEQAQQTRRMGTARQGRQLEQPEQGTRMEGMGQVHYRPPVQKKKPPGRRRPARLPDERADWLLLQPYSESNACALLRLVSTVTPPVQAKV